MEDIDRRVNKNNSDQYSILRLIRDNELTEQIKSLQKALAHERGENYRFRQEVLALLRQRF
jgi:hypothetical protein